MRIRKILNLFLPCKHKNTRFVRNIYGDEINYRDGARSEWICDNCGKYRYSYKLVNDFVSSSREVDGWFEDEDS